MVDRIETKRGVLYHRRLPHQSDLTWVSYGSVSIEEVYGLLPEMIPNSDLRDKVEGVLDTGSEAILAFLNAGGLVTPGGEMMLGFQRIVPLTAEDALRINNEVILNFGAEWINKQYKPFLSPSLQLLQNLFLFREKAETSLRGEFLVTYGQEKGHVRFYCGESTLVPDGVFWGVYKRIYSEAGLPQIVSAASLVRMLLIDVCESLGQGFKQIYKKNLKIYGLPQASQEE